MLKVHISGIDQQQSLGDRHIEKDTSDLQVHVNVNLGSPLYRNIQKPKKTLEENVIFLEVGMMP